MVKNQNDLISLDKGRKITNPLFLLKLISGLFIIFLLYWITSWYFNTSRRDYYRDFFILDSKDNPYFILFFGVFAPVLMITIVYILIKSIKKRKLRKPMMRYFFTFLSLIGVIMLIYILHFEIVLFIPITLLISFFAFVIFVIYLNYSKARQIKKKLTVYRLSEKK
ncbi:hypothetical protein LCGC14_2037270 [marine sediment metagenome]|uniref:Uncharacterized protein n=1 Tax=marine sediment metagenome TaxID=412755 RepID=A0A0F9H6D0_9ZZZZ